jgi:hypothetical protein
MRDLVAKAGCPAGGCAEADAPPRRIATGGGELMPERSEDESRSGRSAAVGGTGDSGAHGDRAPAAAESAGDTVESGGEAVAPQGDSAENEASAASGTRSSDSQSNKAHEEQMNPEQTQVFESYHEDLEAVERKIAGEIDPGYRAMVVAGAVFALLLTLILPHAGHTRGMDILLYDHTAVADHIGLPSRVFQWFVLIFGIVFSSLALLTRRWALAWIAVAGSAVGSVFGVLSIWHRQTPDLGNYHGAGPSYGLILGVIAMVVLTFHWLKVVWSRTAVQLEAEERRRIAAAEEEERSRRWLRGEDDPEEK